MRALDAALAYAARGWRVFPCDETKHPLTPHGFHDASSDPDRIRRWWGRHPTALIGFWPGPSDIAVLDIDMKGGVDGLATFVALENCPILPPVPTVCTPAGGWHLHYRMPEPRIGITAGSRGRGIGVGLDWRGDDGFALLPTPGSLYRWDHWHYGNCTPLPVPPALMPKPLPQQNRSIEPSPVRSRALAGALRFLAAAPPNSRNNALFWTACRFAEAIESELIDACDAQATLVHAGMRLGLTERETRATINSAFRGNGHG